jgi:hypothetical protein
VKLDTKKTLSVFGKGFFISLHFKLCMKPIQLLDDALHDDPGDGGGNGYDYDARDKRHDGTSRNAGARDNDDNDYYDRVNRAQQRILKL